MNTNHFADDVEFDFGKLRQSEASRRTTKERMNFPAMNETATTNAPSVDVMISKYYLCYVTKAGLQ